MIEDISTAIEKASSGCIDGTGRVCNFYKVSDNTGAKVYTDLEVAENNLNSQLYLYDLGFAPEVRSELIHFNNGHSDRYMFLTEMAKTIKEICYEEDISECQCELHYDDCECSLGDDFHKHDRFPEMAELFANLAEEGLDDDDAHWDNYGYLEDGTAVAIDCEFPHLYN